MDKNKLDFVTICFNHELELNLMKLQALSFKYVEPKMISNIIIFYNDMGVNKLEFIKQYYPVILQSKVTIIYRDNVIDKCHDSGWKNQQFFKLFISNYIKSKYYIMLDCKNHFIRKTTLADFIKNDKTMLEREPLNKLVKKKEVVAFRHKKFWQCMDTMRDKNILLALLKNKKAPWKKLKKFS